MAKEDKNIIDWDNLEDDFSENKETETNKPDDEKRNSALLFAERNKLKIEQIEQIRAIKEEMMQKYPDHDIIAFAVRGINRDRWYIVRSLDISDMDIVNQHIRSVARQILKNDEERKRKIEAEKAKAGQKGMVPDKELIAKLTEEMENSPMLIDEAQDNQMMIQGVLYPPDFATKLKNKKLRPGDIAHILQAIIGLSGYFRPVTEDSAEQLLEGDVFDFPDEVVVDNE
jgi:hypothetical protein